MKYTHFSILAILMLGLSATSFAKSFSFVETYTPANLYTSASSTNLSKIAVISDTDNTIYRLDSGQSLKIKLTIPPGVDVFTASAQVSKWKTSSTTGEFMYAKSMNDFSTVEDYGATFSTSFPFQFVNTAFEDSDVPISVVSNDTTTSQKTGYMVFDNTTTNDALLLKTISIQFTVNSGMLSTYNSWVESTGSSLPVTLNVNGGGGGSSTGTTDGNSSGNGSSGTVITGTTSNNINTCSPFFGNCGTGTSTPDTSTPGTSTGGTSTGSTGTDQPPLTTTPTDATMTDGTSTGTFEEVNNSSSESYYLWDSVADGSDRSGETGTRHIRVRIEKNQFTSISDKLDNLDNGNLIPISGVKRELVKVATDGGNLTLYPYAEDPDGLIKAIASFYPHDTMGISKKGMVYVIIEGAILYGYLDYYIIKPDTEQSNGSFSFGAIEIENGMAVMKITYPSGVTQNMYFYSSPLSAINN